MSQPIRGQGGHLVFSDRPENTNLAEDVEIVLPVKFRWILFSGYRGEVENVSAIGYFVFPILPKSTNFVEDVKIMVPVKFR